MKDNRKTQRLVPLEKRVRETIAAIIARMRAVEPQPRQPWREPALSEAESERGYSARGAE